MLLKKYGVNYRFVLGLGNIGGICDFDKKEIRLTHNPGVMSSTLSGRWHTKLGTRLMAS